VNYRIQLIMKKRFKLNSFWKIKKYDGDLHWLKIFMHTKFIKIDLTFMFFPHVPTKSIHGPKGEKKIKKKKEAEEKNIWQCSCGCFSNNFLYRNACQWCFFIF